jgi:hypothetical protein
MPLDKHNWPSVEAVKRSLQTQFRIPELPQVIAHWFEFLQRVEDTDLYTGDDLLNGIRTTDYANLLCALDGYRFVLDAKASSQNHLIWHDQRLIGAWNEHWIVLLSSNGDPYIGDLSDPVVPVYRADHGAGKWSPELFQPNLKAFIDTIRVEERVMMKVTPQSVYSVVLNGFGEQPNKTLLALKRLPDYADMTPAQLLALRTSIPIILGDQNYSEPSATRIADMLRRAGAQVELVLERQNVDR